MEIATHIEALRHEGARMTTTARAVSPDALVPSCPDWVARDLIRHTGGIHRWATGYVAETRTEGKGGSLEEIVGRWPDDDELADWFEAGWLGLVAALEAAPPDLECWTFLPGPSPLAVWSRRQAHETAIHRVDTELAAGRPIGEVAPFTPAFAADGVDELLTCFVPKRSSKVRAQERVTLAVHCTDDNSSWTLAVGPDGVTVNAGVDPAAGRGHGACTARGAAGELYLALWRRAGSERLQIEGDRAVLDALDEALPLRWA
ncbi:MAG TPA: maleylpyruvate isomerase family mycothiol-dependent enzyme [Acidimicrobiales bacterium]|nr:maleylpyruvate isomerase family mycothiol-dependent enzyme [Acidimicrobiales bacterium]